MEQETKSPAELRAQADAMEAEAAKANRGRLYIHTHGGFPFLHEGTPLDEHTITTFGSYREATDAEIQALRTIPEFAARLDNVRGA